MPCVFCDIAAARAPAQVVLDEGPVIAFLDTHPLFAGHVLVVPKVHLETLVDLPAELIQPLFAQVRRVAASIPVALGAQGTFVASNNKVSQSVPHFHVHVVPRTRGDGLKGFFWPRRRYAPGEAELVTMRLRAALSGIP